MKTHGIFIFLALMAISRSSAQNISEIAKSDPLIITGAIGTRNTFYHASGGNGYASPLSSSIYANFNISLYGISMPFSFYYSNDNYQFSYPQLSFNISPSYKGWTLHFGQRSMPFSTYVYNIPFNGVGLEYKRAKGMGLRIGAFYGVLRKAVNATPDDISVRNPAFRRTGWGFKLGFGDNRNYFDFYLFRAKDHLTSIDDIWQDKLNAKENIVVGLKGKMALGRHFQCSANVATSIFSSDINAAIINSEEAKKYNKFFDVRYSSLMRWAGDVAVTTMWKNFSTSIIYKMIQPDYNSLGVSYINNNYHSLGVAATGRIGNLMLSGNFSGQRDNLSNEQLQTTKGYVYSANVSLPIGTHVNLTANYNGYLQKQFAGAAPINDSTRIHRTMNSYSLSGTYDVTTERVGHSASITTNYSQNRDLNKYATGQSDVNTLAIGLGYNMAVIPIETNFSFNYSRQSSDGYDTRYITDLYSVTASKALLKNKKLQCSATFSVINNQMDGTSNLSLGGNAALGYSLFDVHNFSFSLNYNHYTSSDLVAEEYRRKTNSYDLSCTLNYTYTFTAFSIKRNAEKEKGKRYDFYSDFSRSAYRERKLKSLQENKNKENRETIKNVEF